MVVQSSLRLAIFVWALLVFVRLNGTSAGDEEMWNELYSRPAERYYGYASGARVGPRRQRRQEHRELMQRQAVTRQASRQSQGSDWQDFKFGCFFYHKTSFSDPDNVYCCPVDDEFLLDCGVLLRKNRKAAHVVLWGCWCPWVFVASVLIIVAIIWPNNCCCSCCCFFSMTNALSLSCCCCSWWFVHYHYYELHCWLHLLLSLLFQLLEGTFLLYSNASIVYYMDDTKDYKVKSDWF